MKRLALVMALLLSQSARADDVRKKWRQLETPHFHIVYYTLPGGKGEEAVAQRLAPIAEEQHAGLVKLLGPGLTKKRKTWIIITDDTDEYNGSATVQPYPYIRLYATTPDDRADHNDWDDWLRDLFLHEYTHILHIGTIGGFCAPLVNALLGWGLGIVYPPNQAQPRFIIEGLAVFEESMHSTGGRLRNSIWNMYLRMQALEGKFMTLDQFSNVPIQFPDVNAAYLYGSALTRYVAETYGEDVLRKTYADYGSVCIPGGINRSLRRVIHKTWVDVYREFRAEMQRRFTAQRDALAQRGFTPSRELLSGWQNPSMRPVFLPDGKEVLVVEDDGHRAPAFRRIDVATGKSRVDFSDFTAYAASGLSLSADGNTLVFGALAPWSTFYYYSDLWTVDRRTRKVEQITDGLRASNPAISPDGARVAFEINDAASRGLALLDRASGKIETLIPTGSFEAVYKPEFSPDGKTLAFSWWRTGGFRDIWLMDLATKKLTQLTNDRAIDTEPRFSPDGKWLYFVSDRTGIYNLYAWEFASGKLMQATNVLGGVFDPAISPDGKRVVFSGFRAQGYTLETAELDPAKWWEAAPQILERGESPPVPAAPPIPSHRYNPLWTAVPWTFTPFAAPDGYGELLGFRLKGNDIVGHHLWNLSLGFGSGRSDDVNFSASYTYDGLWPSFSLGVSRALSPRQGLVINGADVGYDEDAWNFGGSISLPLVRKMVQSSDLSVSYSLAYTRNIDRIPAPDPSAITPQLPETGRLAGVGVTWSYSDSRRFRYSVSPEAGRDLGLTAAIGSRWLGSQYEVYSISWHWTEWIGMPWHHPRSLANHVLMLAYSGGLCGGDLRHRGYYYLGGYPQQNLLSSIYDFSRPGSASLRGYPYASIAGDQYHVLNIEYRFPIWWIEKGFETLPLYLRRLHGRIFVDYGGAFSGGFSFDKLKVGVGAELMLEIFYFWYFPAALQLGYARGIDSGGGNQVYFLLNNPF